MPCNSSAKSPHTIVRRQTARSQCASDRNGSAPSFSSVRTHDRGWHDSHLSVVTGAALPDIPLCQQLRPWWYRQGVLRRTSDWMAGRSCPVRYNRRPEGSWRPARLRRWWWRHNRTHAPASVVSRPRRGFRRCSASVGSGLCSAFGFERAKQPLHGSRSGLRQRCAACRSCETPAAALRAALGYHEQLCVKKRRVGADQSRK